jgi:hypothetical protein
MFARGLGFEQFSAIIPLNLLKCARFAVYRHQSVPNGARPRVD